MKYLKPKQMLFLNKLFTFSKKISKKSSSATVQISSSGFILDTQFDIKWLLARSHTPAAGSAKCLRVLRN